MEDHDQRFKLLIRTFFREFIELFFAHWADRFDWSSVQWLEQEAFLDPPQGRRRELDLVAQLALIEPVQASPREAESFLILIHVEVDSGDGVAAVPRSMFGYYSWLRARQRLPVFPIGLFLQIGLDGIGWGWHRESLWNESLLEFRYPYIGLPALDAHAYLDGDSPLGIALSVLMRISKADRARVKAEAMQRLATSSLDAARRYLLCECVGARVCQVGLCRIIQKC